jgi:outer membrane receptor for monomeric catechols
MKGNFTGTAASVKAIDASVYRDCLLIQKTNATTIAIGIGEAAVAGEGVQLVNANDAIILRGAQAREAIYVIGNGGTATYQDGNIEFVAGPKVA